MNKTKPISSPTRTDTITFPPPLTTFLRTNFGSKSTRRNSSRSRLIFRRRRQLTLETPQSAEPSSPKVTCIGQVRSRKTTPSRRRRIKVSKSPVFRCRWIDRVRKAMLCFSKRCRKLTWQRSTPSVRKWVCCGAQNDLNRDRNRVVRSPGGEREEEGGNSKSKIEIRQPSEAADDCNSTTLPPRNALQLTRCRSASSVGTSTTRFWSSPSTSKDESEEEGEMEGTVHVRDDNETSGNELKQGDSTAESRRDLESLKLCENRGSEVVVAGVESGSGGARLKRCRSEPGRVMERLVSDPELDLRWRRKSAFDSV